MLHGLRKPCFSIAHALEPGEATSDIGFYRTMTHVPERLYGYID